MTSDGNKRNLHTTLLPSEQFHHSKTTSYPPFQDHKEGCCSHESIKVWTMKWRITILFYTYNNNHNNHHHFHGWSGVELGMEKKNGWIDGYVEWMDDWMNEWSRLHVPFTSFVLELKWIDYTLYCQPYTELWFKIQNPLHFK